MQELSSAHHLRVLLIEDNPADARLALALLDACDELELSWVTTLDAALAELSGGRFDAVLLDLRLPDSSGTDPLPAVRRAAPDAAIVVASGQADDDWLLARAIIRKGADDFLPKAGLTSPLLARTIVTAVERRRAMAALRARAADLDAALLDARIGHLSWMPGDLDAAVAGDFAGLLGLPPAASRQSLRGIWRRLSVPTRKSVSAAWRELRAGADRLALVLVEDDGSLGWQRHDLLLEATARRAADGHIVRVEVLLRDTTMLGHVERLEGEMLTQLAHELRTPLTTVRGALGLLAHGEAAAIDGAAETLLQNAIANTDRINRVISETLARGDRQSSQHLQTTGQPPRPSPRPSLQPSPRPSRRVAVGPYLADALAARLPFTEARDRGAGLSLTPAGRAHEVMVDGARLRRAIDYLFARLRSGADPAERLVLDVTVEAGIAWLALQPEGSADPAAVGRAGPRPAAPRVHSRSAGRAAGLRIAVPVAA